MRSIILSSCIFILIALPNTTSIHFNISNLFDYGKFLRKFGKSIAFENSSYRSQLFLSRSIEIFKHNIVYNHRKSNYYLSQNVMTDVDPIEFNSAQSTANSELKTVKEALEFGDLPANFLESVQSISNDVKIRANHHQLEEQVARFIDSNGSEGMKKVLDELDENWMNIKSGLDADLRPSNNDVIQSEDTLSPFIDSIDVLIKSQAKKDTNSDIYSKESPRAKQPIEYDIDWRETKCISRPKNQGQCNSCYIMATLDLMEYFYCRTSHTNLQFSTQHILDCCPKLDEMRGCQGGRMSSVARFIRTSGLRLECDYPYEGLDGLCRLNRSVNNQVLPKIRSWHLFDSITAWYDWIDKMPILVGINIPRDFFIYGGGIHDGLNCNLSKTHAMLLVGSGNQDGLDFWLLKNSFSDSWGESGYFRLSKSAPLSCFGSAIVAKVTFR